MATNSFRIELAAMLDLDPKQNFMFREASILAWNASVQRAKLYRKDIPLEDRRKGEFRENILKFIEETILHKYETGSTIDDHVANIQTLVMHGTRTDEGILGIDGYKFGVAQKLLNLLLKYLWCLGHIHEPPHCPVDRIVLGKTSLKGKMNWTQITSKEQYLKAIDEIHAMAKKEGLTLPEWELKHFLRR